MSKKIENLSSNNFMSSELKINNLLDHKFKERLAVSKEFHQRILDSSFTKKAPTTYFFWYAAAGLALLISLNVFSIRSHSEQKRNEYLKEFYNNDWNNSTIF